jgi:hypothetical protein
MMKRPVKARNSYSYGGPQSSLSMLTDVSPTPNELGSRCHITGAVLVTSRIPPSRIAAPQRSAASAAAGDVCPVSPTPTGIRVLCTLSRRERLERAASTQEFVEHAVECAESD